MWPVQRDGKCTGIHLLLISVLQISYMLKGTTFLILGTKQLPFQTKRPKVSFLSKTVSTGTLGAGVHCLQYLDSTPFYIVPLMSLPLH